MNKDAQGIAAGLIVFWFVMTFFVWISPGKWWRWPFKFHENQRGGEIVEAIANAGAYTTALGLAGVIWVILRTLLG